MTLLADLHRNVQATLASKRLGQPVFVRYHLESRDPRAAVPVRLAMVLQQLHQWFGQPAQRLYGTGEPQPGQVTLTIEWPTGSTGILSWAEGTSVDRLDLTVLGNHGALYHELPGGAVWELPPTTNPPPDIARLAGLIEQAMRTSEAVKIP